MPDHACWLVFGWYGPYQKTVLLGQINALHMFTISYARFSLAIFHKCCQKLCRKSFFEDMWLKNADDQLVHMCRNANNDQLLQWVDDVVRQSLTSSYMFALRASTASAT